MMLDFVMFWYQSLLNKIPDRYHHQLRSGTIGYLPVRLAWQMKHGFFW